MKGPDYPKDNNHPEVNMGSSIHACSLQKSLTRFLNIISFWNFAEYWGGGVMVRYGALTKRDVPLSRPPHLQLWLDKLSSDNTTHYQIKIETGVYALFWFKVQLWKLHWRQKYGHTCLSKWSRPGPGLSENIPVCVPVDLVSLSQSDGVGNVAWTDSPKWDHWTSATLFTPSTPSSAPSLQWE